MGSNKRLIKIAHSPDSDDAFMFYALKQGLIVSDLYEFEIERRDIEELNHLAQDEVYDITAISIHAYAYLHDCYVLTASGASMAEKNYGPMVVACQDYTQSDLKNLCVAVPGLWTTAHLVLKLIEPQIKTQVVPFEKIMDHVLSGKVDAGLIIHEGQLEYQKLGLKKVLSLIDFWRDLAGDLPLPLGGSAIKKSLGNQVIQDLALLQKQSIEYAMTHPDKARDYAMQFKRDLSADQADLYLSWYANTRSVDMGEDGRRAIQFLFDVAQKKGVLDDSVDLQIV